MSHQVAHVSEIVTPTEPDAGKASWRAVRRHFGISSFGVSAYVAEAAGEALVGDHTELDTAHEELFYVATGRAAVRAGDEKVDAGPGTFLYVQDPAVIRSATALEPGTTLLVVGGEPGKAFEVSQWEREYVEGD
jgi:uncharacterized RmlC-like cupin family protein